MTLNKVSNAGRLSSDPLQSPVLKEFIHISAQKHLDPVACEDRLMMSLALALHRMDAAN